MMTPRCRKPVVLVSGSNLCHLANISTLGTNRKQFYQEGNCDSCNSVAVDENVNTKEDCPIGSSDSRYSTENIAIKTFGSNAKNYQALVEDKGENVDLTAEMWSSFSQDVASNSGSLTSTFRSYLLNRSVLTASPVDLSFSSRTGDFDTSESKMEEILGRETLSSSLLYCLDGNQPPVSEVIDEQTSDVYGSSSSSRHTGTPLKEQLVEQTNLQSYDTSTKEDRKICQVNSSTVLQMSNLKQFNKNIIQETSL